MATTIAANAKIATDESNVAIAPTKSTFGTDNGLGPRKSRDLTPARVAVGLLRVALER